MTMVRTIRRSIIVLLLVFLMAAVVALAYLHFANLNHYRDQISNRISTLTGRHVTIGDVDVNLWPLLTVTTDNLAVANTSWGSQANMAEIGHLSASVHFMSLLFGPVLLEDFTLGNVNLLLEYDQQGKSNWSPAGGYEEARDNIAKQQDIDSGTGGLPIMLDKVDISNIKLIRRKSGAPDQQFYLDYLTIKANKEDRLDVAVTGNIVDLPLQLNGQFGTRKQLRDHGDGDFSMTGSLGDLNLETKGHLVISGSRGTTHIETVVSSNDVAAFIKSIDLPITLSGPLTLRADANVEAGGGTITLAGSLSEFNAMATLVMDGNNINIDARLKNTDRLGTMLGISSLPREDISVKGELALKDDGVKLHDIIITTGKSRIFANGNLAPGDGVSSLQIRAKGDSLAELMINLPPLAFDGAVDLTLSPGEVKVDPLKLQLGASDLAGNFRIIGTDNITIKAGLESKNLDLIEFSAHEKKAGPKLQPSVTKAPDKSASTVNKYVFSDDPLPFDRLQHSELDFDLSIDKLTTSALTMNKVKARGTLHKGVLKGSFGIQTPGGGRSKNRIVLDASGKQANLQAHLDARGLRVKVLSGKVKDIKEIPVTDLTADIESSGNSLHALAANSSGRLIIIMGPGLIDNSIMTNVSADILAQLLSALNPFVKRDPYAKLDCSIVVLDIKGGKSTIENLLVQNDKVMIVAAGKVDLKTERLDIEFNTKPRQGVGVSADMFVTPFVALGGKLANPRIILKKKGTLLTMGAAIASGGLTLVLQGGIDRVAGEGDQCEVMLPKYPLPPLAED